MSTTLIYARGEEARAVTVTDFGGTQGLFFVSATLDRDIESLINEYGAVKTLELVLASPSHTDDFELPCSVATQRLLRWRREAEQAGFKLVFNR